MGCLTRETHGLEGIAESNAGRGKDTDRGRLFQQIHVPQGPHASLE